MKNPGKITRPDSDYNSLQILDSLRGVTALYVLVHHARLLFTQPYYEGYMLYKDQYNLVDQILVYGLSIFKYGHEAVI